MTEPQSQSSDSDKLAATLVQLEAEREKRLAAGAWSGSERTILMAVVAEGESEEVAQRRALYQYLAKNPEGPQSINAFDWIIIETVGPPPTVELPKEQFDQPVDAINVTPWRPPMPSAPPEPPRVEPLSYSNAGVPRVVLERELRRYRNFLDGDWGDPSDGPIPYPRRNRNGW